MKHPTRTAAPILLMALFSTALLTGCTPPAGTGSDPADDGSGSSQNPCVVGTWHLDVADYASQAESYVLGLGIPIEGFAMEGAGTIQFTTDGLVATDIDLTTTGTIVAGETSVPLNSRSGYNASGDWSIGSDGSSLNLANWSNTPDPDVPVDPSAPPIPAIDYTDIPSLAAVCTTSTLVLKAPDAPMSAQWTR